MLAALLGCALIVSGAFAGVAQANGGGDPAPHADACAKALGHADVAPPTRTTAWRAELKFRMPVLRHVPDSHFRVSEWIAPRNAPWVLVVRGPHDGDGRCWIKVRLPWRPNTAAGWVNVRDVVLQPTSWRIVVSRAHRTLTLWHSGKPLRTLSVVVGKPSTPTPSGLFAIAWVVRWHPNFFLGSWVLMLTAHSDVLKNFDGGDGTVAIHGRGGASLLDALGTASSHGCVRVANDAIDWLVRTVGQDELPATPVEIS